MLQYKKITEHKIYCPYCSTAIVKIEGTNFTILLDDTWIKNGDSISGLWEKLIEGGKVSEFAYTLGHPDNENYHIKAMDFHLGFGEQVCCGQSYNLITFNIVDEKIDYIFQQTYFHLNMPQGKTDYYLITNDDLSKCPLKEWTATHYVDAKVPFLSHDIGLFTIENQDEINEENDVSSCSYLNEWDRAANISLNIWNDAVDLQKRFRKEIDSDKI